ncbi:hypothetical protein MTO96_035316 [Rhipicephalus appendiculatus]
MTDESEEDTGTEVSRIEPQREEDDDKKTLIIVAALLCAGLLIASIAAAFWTMSGGDEPDDNKEGAGGRNKTLPTTTSVIKSTTTTSSKSPSTSQPSTTKTSPSTTSTTTTPPRLTLVCTVMKYPAGLADGACDHVFFDSLYSKYDSDFLYFPQSHTNFLNVAAKSNLTLFGLSIEVSAIGQFRPAFNSPEGQKIRKILLNARVQNWGFLNLHEKDMQENPDVLKDALTTLKEIEDYQKQQAKIEPYMVLGIYFAPALCDQVAQYFKTLFLPRHVILLGQIAYGRSNPCAVLPANNYIDPRQEKKDLKSGHTVRNASDSASCLQKKGIKISFSVSVEMESYQFHARLRKA